MPDHLHLPFTVLILLFNLLSIASSGRAFHRMTPDGRSRCLARSRASRVGPVRDLVRFFDALVLYDLCEQEAAKA